MGVEIKFKGEWYKIISIRPETPLPCDGATLPPYWELDNGMQIHPANPQIEEKRRCKGYPIKFNNGKN